MACIRTSAFRKILIIGIVIGLLAPAVVGAQFTADEEPGCVPSPDSPDIITIQTDLPGISYGMTTTDGKDVYVVKNYGCFIIGVYKYLAGVAGILATVMMMWGGYNYVISFGSASKFQQAQDIIVSAMIGLALVLGSYVILYTINPDLVQFRDLKIPPVSEIAQGEFKVIRICDPTKDTDLMKNGDLVACGLKRVLSDTEACIGISCPRSLFGDFAYCNLTDLVRYAEDKGPEWTKGNCISTQKVTGVRASDGATYTVSTMFTGLFTLERSCGELERPIGSGSDLVVGTGCDDDLACVSYDAPPIDVEIETLSLSGTATNFECR